LSKQSLPPENGVSHGTAAAAPSPWRDLLSRTLVLVFVFQVISGILVSPMFSLFPIYCERILGLSTIFSGYIRIVFVVLGGVMALVGGALADALGRKPVYLLAMTGVISSGLLFLVPTWLMFPLAIYSGLMFGLGTIAGQSLVMDTVPARSLALATGCYFLTGTLGNALGGWISGIIASQYAHGYTILGASMSLGHLGLLLIAALLLPAQPRPEKRRTVEGMFNGMAQLLRRRDVWALLGLRFLPTAYWGCATFLLPVLLYRLTRTEQAAGDYTAASAVLSAICQFSAGRLVDRMGPTRPVVGAISILTLCALSQGIWADSPWGLVGFGLLAGGAAWSLSISMTTLVQALSSEQTKARLLGLTHMAWSAGFVSGTFFGSQVAAVSNHGGTAFLVCAGGCGVAVGLALVVVRAVARGGARNQAVTGAS
jgi:MFS family permease